MEIVTSGKNATDDLCVRLIAGRKDNNSLLAARFTSKAPRIMNLKDPIAVYTAATNLEAHVIVNMLNDNGVPAFAVEDQSGASLWMFGTISQFHDPKVWIDKSSALEAGQLIHGFEKRKNERRNLSIRTQGLPVLCEACGKTATFPDTFDGTVQRCPECHTYIDVGDVSLDQDFGEFDEA